MSRIRSRLTYANVVATICLFLVLSGGTAVALTGSNTVFSDDIVNDQVFSGDVRNDTLNGGGLAAADLRAESVGASEVKVDSLTGNEVKSDSLTGDDVNESSLTRVPSATHANNSANLGGLSSTAYQRRVTEACGPVQAIDAIDADGTVSCAPRAVFPIAATVADGDVQYITFTGSALRLRVHCRGTDVEFENLGSSTATLNWQFSEGTSSSTTVNASGTVVSPFNNVDFLYGNSGRLEGQWIFSTPESITTVTLHTFQGPDSCEVRGTAEVAPL